jgi:RNA 2',3'-cyclic 3'-phosphodiesterase
MRRCFLALRVEETCKDRLLALQAELARLPPDAARRLRLTARDNLHATVLFLGSTSEPELAKLETLLADVVAKTPKPAQVEVAGAGAFPSSERPRAVFAAIGEGRAWLVDLSRRTAEACAKAGLLERTSGDSEKERVPHVTLARVEQARRRGPLSDWLAGVPATVWGRLHSNKLVLFESKPGPHGSRYEPLRELELA